MVCIMTKQPSDIDLELYELVFPGQLIGKAVIDSEARMVGVIRNVRFQVPSSSVSLIVKGLRGFYTVFILPSYIIKNRRSYSQHVTRKIHRNTVAKIPALSSGNKKSANVLPIKKKKNIENE